MHYLCDNETDVMTIREILKHYWGYDSFRPLQEEIILSVIDGKDTLALMPTGGGKSITYQVPALFLEGTCIVITPLIALMKDQVEDLLRRGIPAGAIYTGMEREDVESTVNKALARRLKFLYVSPERLVSAYFRERLKQMQVSLLAVDEAHCISQWGYDFRPSYLRIAEIREFFPAVPVLALTATATPKVAEDIQRQLHFARPHVLSKSFRRENLSYVVRKANDKLGETLHILSNLPSSAIVYVRKRVTAEELAAFLNAKGIRAAYYHAGLPPLQRAMRQEAWKKGECPVMVATNAFGMGIDKPDVRIVLHFDIPDSPEAYFQEAGRAGRDGKRAYAVLLYNEAALTACKKRVEKRFPDIKYVREIYRLLGNFFQVEEGAGKGFAFEFDPDLFVKTYQLDYVSALAAIETLQVSGYLECTTDIHARSQVQFLVLRDRLYGIEFHPPLQERIVEFILRTCAGVFVRPSLHRLPPAPCPRILPARQSRCLSRPQKVLHAKDKPDGRLHRNPRLPPALPHGLFRAKGKSPLRNMRLLPLAEKVCQGSRQKTPHAKHLGTFARLGLRPPHPHIQSRCRSRLCHRLHPPTPGGGQNYLQIPRNPCPEITGIAFASTLFHTQIKLTNSTS